MPNDQNLWNFISRIFKSNPYPDLFRVLIDSLDDSLLVITGDGLKILACNHSFLLLTGYARSEISSLTPNEIFPDPEGSQALEQILECWQNGDCHLKDIPLKGRHGSITQVDLQARPSGGQGSPLILRARPSSQRLQQLQQARTAITLQESLSNLAHTLLLTRPWSSEDLSLPDGSPKSTPKNRTDGPQEGAETTCLEALEQARDLLFADCLGIYRISPTRPDYELQGVLPDPFPISLPTSEISPLIPSIQWSIGQRPAPALHRAARAAGLETLRTEAIGMPEAWIGILVAGWREKNQVPEEIEWLMRTLAELFHASLRISQEQAAILELEQSLDALQQEFEDISTAVSEAILALDDDLAVVWANRSAEQVLGYRPEEMEGLPVKDLLVGPDNPLATLLDAIGHERQAERQRLTIHRRDGTPFPVHIRAIPTRARQRSRLLVTLIDQSERQAIEDQSEQLAQRALLGEVAAIFAHEVRNPINNISTGVQLISSRLGREHPLHESLDRIRKECVRLDQLMTDVLFFARPLELKIVPLDLKQLIDRLLVRWRPRFKQAGIETFTSFSPGTPKAEIDPRTFEQVIVNLMTNALQAMKEGGTLSISIEPGSDPSGGVVELKIADSGPGIPSDVMGRIFDPFFTTKKEGTGLGLAIARRILAAHKGVILVESYPDAGTVFTIRVPSAREEG